MANSWYSPDAGCLIEDIGSPCDRSFVGVVIEYRQRDGRVVQSAGDPQAALGAPDYSGNVDDGSFLSLGCSGSVTLQLTDNAVIDVDGPDLYVFEVGPRVEAMPRDAARPSRSPTMRPCLAAARTAGSRSSDTRPG